MEKIVKLDEYQKIIMSSLLYPPKDKGKQLEYGVLALCGESGELANVLKKVIYHKETSLSGANIIDELSDVLWYVAYVADALDIKLSELATFSIRKMLTKRTAKGKHKLIKNVYGD